MGNDHPTDERSSSSGPKSTRRAFLKTAAAGTGAAALGSLAAGRAAHAAGEQVIRIGMIGCGGRCTGAASQSLKAGPDVRLVAMCDVFEQRLKSSLSGLARRHPDQVAVDEDHQFVGFDGYKKVIDSVDVVLIACASKFHPMYAEAAVKAGKHVFVEKPHGIDPVGVRRMQAACDLAREKGVSLVSGLQSRFRRGWQETVARIHDGAIGEVTAIQSMFLRGPYGLVRRDQMPKWAFGLAGRSSSFGEVYGDMFDHHTAVYEYESGTRIYALCRTQNGCYNNGTDIVMGTKGKCYLGPCRIEGETNWKFPGPDNNPYDEEQKALIESVRRGEPINSGHYMANSTMVAVLGQLACYSGKSITWDQAVQSDFQFGPPPDEASFETPPPVLPDETGNYPLPKPGLTKLL